MVDNLRNSGRFHIPSLEIIYKWLIAYKYAACHDNCTQQRKCQYSGCSGVSPPSNFENQGDEHAIVT